MSVDVGSAVGYLDIDIKGFVDGMRKALDTIEGSVETMNVGQKQEKHSEKW
jgi:hypothetical protein